MLIGVDSEIPLTGSNANVTFIDSDLRKNAHPLCASISPSVKWAYSNIAMPAS